MVPWPSFFHACYRKNRAATGVTAVMLSIHRSLHTYKRMVDIYIALTEFAKKKFIQGGIPKRKIIVKPNFLEADPGNGNGCGGYALFVGRLTPEKGINILLSAWEKSGRKIPLKVVGDGPLSFHVAEAVRKNPKITWIGWQPRHIVLRLLKDASVLIFPSICYEGLPMAIIEAYSVGLAVVASNIGSMSSMIEHGRTGLHFTPGNQNDLAAKAEWALAHPERMREMGKNARQEYEKKYTSEINYQLLMRIYRRAIEGD